MTAAEARMQTMLGRQVERIAVVRALYLGDMVLAVPALRALRSGFPAATITLIGLPWARDFANRFGPYVDDFMELVSFPGIDEVSADPVRTAEFIEEQRERRYDLVIQMHGSGRTSNRLALALGGTLTAGYYEPDQPSSLDVGAPYPRRGSEIDRNLGLAALLGCPGDDRELEFPIHDEDRAEARAILDEIGIRDRPIIGLHPGSKFPSRRWMPERFAAAATALARESGAAVVVTGNGAEVALAKEVARDITGDACAIAGRTSLGGLAALIERMDVLISNDTGPAHVATALSTPSVTILGPGDVRRWAPTGGGRNAVVRHGVACSPCGYTTCPIDHRCLRSIEVHEVVAAARRVMRREEASWVA